MGSLYCGIITSLCGSILVCNEDIHSRCVSQSESKIIKPYQLIHNTNPPCVSSGPYSIEHEDSCAKKLSTATPALEFSITVTLIAVAHEL